MFINEKDYEHKPLVNHYEKVYLKLGEINIILGEDEHVPKYFGKAIQYSIVSWDDYLLEIRGRIEKEIEKLFETDEPERAIYITENLIKYLISNNLNKNLPEFIIKLSGYLK